MPPIYNRNTTLSPLACNSNLASQHKFIRIAWPWNKHFISCRQVPYNSILYVSSLHVMGFNMCDTFSCHVLQDLWHIFLAQAQIKLIIYFLVLIIKLHNILNHTDVILRPLSYTTFIYLLTHTCMHK